MLKKNPEYLNSQYQEHMWDISDTSLIEQNIVKKTFTHKEEDMLVELEYHSVQQMAVFNMMRKDRGQTFGSGNRYVANLNDFIQDFIFNGKFVMFLAHGKIRAY